MQLGTLVDPNSERIPELIAEWETLIRHESITGPTLQPTTPIVTSQSPPPPTYPVYPSMTQSQPTPIPWLPIILGGAVLLLVVALVRT